MSLHTAVQWLRWQVSPLGRAAAAFRGTRQDYYAYLAQILTDSNGKRTLLTIFQADASRYHGHARGILSAHWARRYEEDGDLMGAWTGTLPEEDLTILSAATRSGGAGALEGALADAARLARRAEESKRQFVGTIFVGVMGVLLACAAVVGIPLFLMPFLQQSFSFIPLDLYGPKGNAMLALSSAIRNWWPVLGFLLLAVPSMFFFSLSRWTGPVRRKWDQHFLPYRLYRDARAAEFLATLSALLERRGNVQLTLREGIEVIRTRSTPWMLHHCNRMLHVLDEPGEHTGSEVLDSGILSKENIFYLADMVEANGDDRGLKVAGHRIEQQIQGAMTRAASRIKVTLMVSGFATTLLMAGWMGFITNEFKGAMTLVFS
jgi:type II secretory pathway component PulF